MGDSYLGTLTVEVRLPSGDWGVRNVIKPDGKRTLGQARALAERTTGRWWELDPSLELRVVEHPHGYDCGYRPSARLVQFAATPPNKDAQPASAGFRF